MSETLCFMAGSLGPAGPDVGLVEDHILGRNRPGGDHPVVVEAAARARVALEPETLHAHAPDVRGPRPAHRREPPRRLEMGAEEHARPLRLDAAGDAGAGHGPPVEAVSGDRV